MSADISERLSSLATKIEQQRSSIETEEATKTAFVMPFISLVLGYDVFNPNEVVPEFIADVGIKRAKRLIMQSSRMTMCRFSLNVNTSVPRST